MKLNELNPLDFNKEKNIKFDVTSLFFHYGDKEIYELLRENIYNHGFLLKHTRLSYENDSKNNNEKIINDCYYNFYYLLINSLNKKEKETILDLALEQRDMRFTAILLSNPEVSLTEQQFENIFNYKNNKPDEAYKYRQLKEFLILNKNIHLTDEQLRNGLLNFDYGLNKAFAKRLSPNIPSDIIDLLIKNDVHDLDEILIDVLEHKEVVFSEKQIDYCLNHSNFLLRLACSKNYHFNFTKEQIIKGLQDEGFDNSDEYEIVDCRELGIEESDVIFNFIENKNIKIPEDFISSLFNDTTNQFNNHLINNLLNRDDIFWNEAQVNYILQLKNHVTVSLLDKCILNDKQILELLYTSKYWSKVLAQKYLIREDIELSETIINVLKLSDCKEINDFLLTRLNEQS